MAMVERTSGPEDPALGLALAGLARVRVAQERYAEAEDAFSQAATILETAWGSGDADRLAALRDYADLLRRTGRPDDADAIMAEVEASRR
jgi:hypothetical protein